MDIKELYYDDPGKQMLIMNYINGATNYKILLMKQFRAAADIGLDVYIEMFVTPWNATITHSLCWAEKINLTKNYYTIHNMEDLGIGTIDKIPSKKNKDVWFTFIYKPYIIRSHMVPFKLLKKVKIYIHIF